MSDENLEAPAAKQEKTSRPGPAKLVVLDLEGSGLRLTDVAEPHHGGLHRPGIDHDCILEVGVMVLDAQTLQEEVRQSWLVLPPGVDSVETFDMWVEALEKADPFVFDMHSHQPNTVDGLGTSLLQDLRALAGAKNPPADPISWVESEVVLRLRASSTLREQAEAKWRAEHPGGAGSGPHLDWSKVHPGNSDLMMTGNSLANYDIPMLKRWMPGVLKTLSYRIMDVSVLRTFYTELSGVKLPAGLDEAIRSGGTGNHRVDDDCEHCADALRELKSYARQAHAGLIADKAYGVAAAYARGMVEEGAYAPLGEVDARIAHLEMLVRYGSRRAIKEERKKIEAREGGYSFGVAPRPEAMSGEGLFRQQGGILRARPEDIEDDFSSFGNGHDR